MEPTEDLVSLWREVFGEPPPIVADPQTVLRVLVGHLDPAPPYQPKPPTDGRSPTPASRKA